MSYTWLYIDKYKNVPIQTSLGELRRMYETNDELFELYVYNQVHTGGDWKIIREVPVINVIVQEVGMIDGDPSPVDPVDFSDSPSDRVTGDSDEDAAGDIDEDAAGDIDEGAPGDSSESATSEGSNTTGIDKKWHEMNNVEILSAIRLGWSKKSWDAGEGDQFVRHWGSMKPTEKDAAINLGFKETNFFVPEGMEPYTPQVPVKWVDYYLDIINLFEDYLLIGSSK